MRYFTVLPLALTILACGGSPTVPAPPAANTAQLRLGAEPVVTLSHGESFALKVEEGNGNGGFVQTPPEGYTWTSSAPDVVAVSAAGVLTAGPGLGQSIVTARASTGASANVVVWVQLPPHVPSTFRITLQYAENVPQAWRTEMNEAAARWEQVIRRELPAVALDTLKLQCPAIPDDPPLTGIERGVRIYVKVSDTFTPGTPVRAVGGPCLHRPHPHPTTIYGRIALNRDKPIEDIPLSERRSIARHEMGHVLGLVGLIQGALCRGSIGTATRIRARWRSRAITGRSAIGSRRSWSRAQPTGPSNWM